MKLSPQMLRVLTNIAAGKGAAFHCRTQSDYGGLTGTIQALIRRGLLTYEHKLTKEGRKAIK